MASIMVNVVVTAHCPHDVVSQCACAYMVLWTLCLPGLGTEGTLISERWCAFV